MTGQDYVEVLSILVGAVIGNVLGVVSFRAYQSWKSRRDWK